MTPRVAIACSGLGHVARGAETWAATVAEGLHKTGGNVILFGSGPRSNARSPYVRIPCLRRDGWLRRFLSWDKAYLYEQVTFARSLRRHLQPDRFDIVHTVDPNVAQQLISHCAKKNIALIYQDGLLIGPSWCSKFKHVHALAPYYKESAKIDTSGWRVIPHLVDSKIFSPAKIKPAGFTLMASGDFSPGSNKRLDWIIEESSRATSRPHLLLAGHADPAALQQIQSLASQKLPGRVKINTEISHAQMPALYQSANVFVHAATREPFGIVLIEAMASGLPVIAQNYPVTAWILGNGGQIIDMTKPGELAAAIDSLATNENLRAQLAADALARARATFDKNVILPMYHDWYNDLALRRDRA